MFFTTSIKFILAYNERNASRDRPVLLFQKILFINNNYDISKVIDYELATIFSPSILLGSYV
jgi:hypothetical protein